MSIIYSNNFESETTGALPSGWRNVTSNASVTTNSPVTGAKSLGESINHDGDLLIYDGKSTLGDQEVHLTTLIMGTDGANRFCVQPFIRDKGTGIDHYLLLVDATNLNIFKNVNAGYGLLQATAHGLTGLNVGVKLHFRFNATGSTIKGRVWKDTDTEPSTWQVSTTDSTYATGSQGVRFGNGGSASLQLNFDDYTIDDLTAMVPTVSIFPGDSRFVTSPYNWRYQGTSYVEANVTGAYIRVKFTGSVLGLVLDPTLYAGYSASQIPILMVEIDGSETRYTLTATQTALNITGLSSGTHTANIWLDAVYVYNDSYNANAIRISEIKAVSFLAPTVRPKKMIVFGDSITKGEANLATTSNDHSTPNTAGSKSYAQYLALQLNAEVGVVAYGGWGWETTSAGGYPRFDTSWNLYNNGNSRLVSGQLSPAPDYLVCNHGTNGTFSSTTVQNWLSTVRAAVPSSTVIFEVLPFNYNRSTANPVVSAGFAAYQSSSNDINAFLIDMGAIGIEEVTNRSSDGIHPQVLADQVIGYSLADKLNLGLSSLSRNILNLNIVANGSGQPVLSWTSDPAAKSYSVLRSGDGNSFVKIASVTTGTTYTDSTPLTGASFYTIASNH